MVAAKNFVRPSDDAAKEDAGRNLETSERNKNEASPAALLVESRTRQKNILSHNAAK